MADIFVLIFVGDSPISLKLQFVITSSKKSMKTPGWFTLNRALSHLRIATAVTLILAAAAMAFVAVRPSSAIAQSTGAQAFPKPMPIPPKKGAIRPAATPTLAPGSPWQLLTNQPPVLDYADCGPGNPILLTDGTVMLQDDGCQDWWKLTPDEFGSYVNGTWTQLASTPAGYSPLYHSSAVLPDGRVIIEGGEYNFLQPVWTNLGAIYDPQTDTWTSVSPPAGWSTIGDAQGVVLFDGTFMQANCCTTQAALLNLNTLTWTPTGKWDLGSCGPTAPSSTLAQTLAVQVIPRSTTRIPESGLRVRIFQAH